MPEIAVILVAAGRSVRFGGGNKLLAPLGGRAVVAWSLRAFTSRSDVGQVVVAASDEAAIRLAFERDGVDDPRVAFCPGGDHRAASVRHALDRVDGRFDLVAIHDGARPLVSQDVIDRTIAAARRHAAVAPALPVNQTVKRATGPLPAVVRETVPRSDLWAMQTPQVVRRVALLDAFARCPMPIEYVTDDVQLIELVGGAVWLVPGDERNIKITTGVDMHVADAMSRGL